MSIPEKTGRSLRPAGEKVAWPQAMTDEGDHGGASVIDGRTQRSAPTKTIVTWRRGGCPHPPTRWPPHPRNSPSSGPTGHLPPGRGKAISVLTQGFPALWRSPHPPPSGAPSPRGRLGTWGRADDIRPGPSSSALRRGRCPQRPVGPPYPFCPFGTFPLDKGNRPRNDSFFDSLGSPCGGAGSEAD